ncbi:DUF2931 family protein [Archangium violaceum]|uniref:DUF2931 family protein n=1 Tax=Archangium violaceum TaxID=83451 RepID=UPI00193C0548|nr:DUF2931 family protein [Archangium violaceum]QRK10911.1 DUF2931 family protein [Archangium violaceum]
MFEWLPTESAPERFPVRLIRGDLFFADGRSIYVPDGRDVANGWGLRGSTHIVDEATKPVPVRLEVAWFSYTEDRFYQGAFELPAEAMTARFMAGVTDPLTGRPLGFERIIVGMAPEGLVSVWMSAGAEVVEMAAFVAPQGSLPWKKVLDNPEVSRADFIRQVLKAKLGADGLARFDREGVPKGLYQGYRVQYLWRPQITGDGTPTGLWIRSFNGENAFIGPAGPAIARDTRPVPAEVQLDWTAPGGTELSAKISFDEAEIFAAFAKLSRGDASHQLALDIEVSGTAASVSLRDAKYILPLQKARIELFRKR